jgi:hypothetical protein
MRSLDKSVARTFTRSYFFLVQGFTEITRFHVDFAASATATTWDASTVSSNQRIEDFSCLCPAELCLPCAIRALHGDVCMR